MRRRLILGTIGMVLAVLGVLEIPLAVTYARREQDSVNTALQRDAAVFGAVSGQIIENPGDHDVDRLAQRFSREPGELVSVVDRVGKRLTSASRLTSDAGFVRILERARGGTASSGERLGLSYVAQPLGDGDDRLGALVIARSDATVDQRVHRFWLALGALDVVVFAVSLFFTMRFSHWVVDPLRRLDDHAAALGAGDLSARAETRDGPPEVVTLARTFNAMADRLNELVTSQRRFVADASHQLRTPLTALRLRLETLDPDDAAGIAATREAALTEATRLSRLVDGLLSLARAEGRRIDREDVKVTEVVLARHDAWAPLAAERGVELSFQAESGRAVRARLAPGHLEQILDNLIDNALDASPAGSSIELRVVGNEVHVIDHGRGMTDDERHRAFDPFWRGSGNGTGLGLAIVDQLARSNDATIVLNRSSTGGIDAVVRFASR